MQTTKWEILFYVLPYMKKDLGVTISADMTVSEQCGIAASNCNQIIGLIRRNIAYTKKLGHCTSA